MTTPTGRPTLRPAAEADYPRVADALARWWTQPGFDSALAVRERVAMVPRLWLQHFASTSLIAEVGPQLCGFLVGFVSPDRPEEGYIHFVGVWPGARRSGVGRQLYAAFFALCRARGCARVRCVASPGNALSIAFHTGMGFSIEPVEGDSSAEAATNATADYDGPGIDRVRFVRPL
ncbi:MAG: GNAT family N-acetyltransferase [Nannocystaceae bacterium]